MELSTEVPIDVDAIEHICCLPDDLYRLRWVSYAYHDISDRLAEGLGRNASWPTFAEWSGVHDQRSAAPRSGQSPP